MTDIKPQDIEALLETFDNSPWQEMRLKVEGLELFLSKTPGAIAHSAAGASSNRSYAVPHGARDSARRAAACNLGRARPSPRPPTFPIIGSRCARRTSGRSIASPKPGAAPYVTVGQTVGADTEVCLIEVMKLFTSVLAGVAGAVRRVLVEDAELVEYDQPLFLIEPA